MSDIGEVFAGLRTLEQERRKSNRQAATVQASEAIALASASSLILTRHSDAHYTLRCDHQDWTLNVYPGNRRIHGSHNYDRPPYLKLPKEWTLLDVVKAAIGTPSEAL